MYQNQVNNTLIPLPHSIEQLPQQWIVVSEVRNLNKYNHKSAFKY